MVLNVSDNITSSNGVHPYTASLQLQTEEACPILVTGHLHPRTRSSITLGCRVSAKARRCEGAKVRSKETDVAPGQYDTLSLYLRMIAQKKLRLLVVYRR
jgi:hypothetical protein